MISPLIHMETDNVSWIRFVGLDPESGSYSRIGKIE